MGGFCCCSLSSCLLLLPQSLSLDITSKLLHHLSPKAMLCSLNRSGSSTLYLSSTLYFSSTCLMQEDRLSSNPATYLQ